MHCCPDLGAKSTTLGILRTEAAMTERKGWSQFQTFWWLWFLTCGWPHYSTCWTHQARVGATLLPLLKYSTPLWAKEVRYSTGWKVLQQSRLAGSQSLAKSDDTLELSENLFVIRIPRKKWRPEGTERWTWSRCTEWRFEQLSWIFLTTMYYIWPCIWRKENKHSIREVVFIHVYTLTFTDIMHASC